MSTPYHPQAYPEENHACPVCGAHAWKRVQNAFCALQEVLDEAGEVSEWEAVDVISDEGADPYLECERGHVWTERAREVIDNTGYDGQTPLLRAEPAGGEEAGG